MAPPARWLPRIRGKVLGSCALLQAWLDQEPSDGDDLERPWSRATILPLLEVCSEDQETIYEAILAIWQLKMCEEEGADDPAWLGLMEAWMVSPLSTRMFARCR